MATERISDQWFTILRTSAELRFGSERAAVLTDELRAMAEAVARVLSEPLNFQAESPVDFPIERADRS
ncbi:hypothetical protein NET03_10890 [Thermomicrobium sp. CFH 73360]|uniref:hypothetical protein n=1 Tax=Thermomicrobium sp. CFH 73360 TaxID=2951987 RepID=UPI002076EFEF|nr:hypothetical protein [Thermomicrobium sp. CFH 73360]MCM8747031.1 hypothetical protein [Thermomicrobium sp. CFH 73360]